MPRRLTIAERLKLINLLLAGTPRKEIRKSFRFNSEEFRSTVRSCFPNKVGALLANELSKEERDAIQAYLVDVAKLEDIKHQCEASGKSFLLEATEDLMAFFGPNSFPDSDISRQIAFYCLGGLDHLTKAIVDTRRSLLAPVARVPADEACMLLEFLEELAAYYGGKRLLADICEMKKIRGSVLLASRGLREAAMCFEEALPFARQAFGGPQLQYLQFFQHVIAHRADWLELDVLSAHDHLKNAIAIFPAEKIDTILKGYYWGLGDLERDEILLDATEAALGGDAVRSSGLMEMWLQQSATLSLCHTNRRVIHISKQSSCYYGG
ncbi:MAG TPA: hypothetical protein VFQ43_19110 [Nitrososphaera sp.]|nr:hypothetical protein [Nitrososphaera sp.]